MMSMFGRLLTAVGVAMLAMTPGVYAAAAANGNAVADATRTPPVTSPTVTGRTCAKRMKGPTSAARCCCGNDYSVWSGYIRRYAPGSCCMPTIGH